jgi:cell wall-associated NlpC family hydrolase
MGHNVLFLSAFLGFSATAFPPAAASATQAEAGFASPVAQAFQVLGTRYRYGGSSPATGFDCSGLIAHVFEQAWGVSLPHSVRAQSQLGARIKRAQLAPGDLVFYNTRGNPYSHVGIYVGEDRFIHAPRPGGAVRVESMNTGYWAKRYNGSRRIAASQPES